MCPAVSSLRVEAVKAGEIAHLIDDPHLRVEAALFRHVPELHPDVGIDWGSVKSDLASIWSKHAHHRTHSGRLSCAVAADQSDDVPGAYLEAHVVERHHNAKTLVEPSDSQHDIENITRTQAVCPESSIFVRAL